MRRTIIAALSVAAMQLLPSAAAAFCGFYVAGAETDLFADATMVVMMREGTTTVLSMQNDYRGPVEDFAMVVPVPVVLAEENVRTLEKDVFARVDRLAAPRLVEYWEQDPCPTEGEGTIGLGNIGTLGHGGGAGEGSGYGRGGALRVRVEAEFAVGEYDIVILSAEDSGDLDTWLRQNDYTIPEGAGDALAPYVQAGMKFFVAKVDVEKVTFEDGRAVLSPLRVHYQSEDFSLPIRLGMLNSSGTQDLIVHVLARNARYEAASYDNLFIPTNLEVADAVRDDFGAFYAALFDEALERHPGAVITEYSWQATGCDPCPGPVLSERDLMTLGADVAIGAGDQGDEDDEDGDGSSLTAWTSQVRLGEPVVEGGQLSPEAVRHITRRHVNELRLCHQTRLVGTPAGDATVRLNLDYTIDAAGATSGISATGASNEGLVACVESALRRWQYPRPHDRRPVTVSIPLLFQPLTRSSRRGSFGSRGGPLQSFVLTRLHYRYGRGELGDDLVMRPAPPVEGGRGVGPANELPTGATPAPANNFQGRYIIRHPWEGPIECDEPRRGRWGGPPADQDRPTGPVAATNLGTQPRGGVRLGELLKQPLPSIGVSRVGAAAQPTPAPAEVPEEPAPAASSDEGGCGGCTTGPGPVGAELGAALLVLALWTRGCRRNR